MAPVVPLGEPRREQARALINGVGRDLLAGPVVVVVLLSRKIDREGMTLRHPGVLVGNPRVARSAVAVLPRQPVVAKRRAWSSSS